MSMYDPLASVDPEVAAALDAELGRQRSTLEMIASENFAPTDVAGARPPRARRDRGWRRSC
jgi:glycine hydroxymethyltransferase